MIGDILEENHKEIVQFFEEKKKWDFSFIPESQVCDFEEGESYSIAYPIQGLLKYHGMADHNHRIAYFPSISLNNDSAFTISYLKLSKEFSEDKFILNGKEIASNKREFDRIQHQLNFIRKYSKCSTKGLVISRNVMKNTLQTTLGKGLGTSASGGAAIAHAAMNILYSEENSIHSNFRLKSIFSRYLAGSASRSSVGGIGLWFNHPKMNAMESYAHRMDGTADKNFINDIDLITISIPANLKTEEAHNIAPLSPFYSQWLRDRKSKILDFANALYEHDFDKIGSFAENDTLNLHAITMTAPLEKSIIVWAPETVAIMKLTRELRDSGIPTYFSIDTGPSTVLLTKSKNTPTIQKALLELNSDFDITIGKIGGASKTVKQVSPEAKLLSGDLKLFNRV
ncbi:Phosphomevalonate decarboxylase [Candidatus Lokiarchaeum ossiferum]|uniref:Phosphomevalonate decarboxylase n=1 Tax=Candidatus Lokiarchaeum ossiferum TaxID=2951803 RepID=A0ABY6HV74_9ARCH|nr:Phosphomevalonate decarboxylase [Candidatus Lokiarchaeum sp. B-35]